jgi:tetratricopeptide (TPR) repeat protein
MSEPVETPTRIVDAAAAGTTEAHAAQLLRALQAPPARLAPSARARIAAALDARAARSPASRALRWPAAVAAALVLFAGGVVGAAWGLVPARRWLGRWLIVESAPAAPARRAVEVPAPPEAPLPAPVIEPLVESATPLAVPEARRARPAHPARAHETPAPSEDPVVAESRLLAGALQELRQRRDPQAALRALDEYERRFPAGALAPEAAAARVDALLALGRRGQALERLDELPLDRLPRGAELRALRGELRAGRGELGAALDDFSAVLAKGSAGAPASVVERALYGRGSCRSRLGDVAGARADLDELLRRFPGSKFAEPARRALRD